ncbi:MAG TPA: transglutaminase family protein [Stellaceae bacterium]|nr:transglutaminase family protein [Stellaceae bacterium]
MTIHVALHHKTTYRYDREVGLGPQVVRLRPAPHCRTPILSYSLKVTPAEHFINWQQDPQSNYLARLTFPEKTRKFEIEVDLVAEMAVFNPFDFFLEEYAENFPFAYEPDLARDLKPYLETEPLGPELTKLLDEIPREPMRTMDFLVGVNQRLQQRIAYVIRMEPGIQTCEYTLSNARGSCRDSAWLMVQALRRLGLAARFVSGYLIQLTPDVKSLDGPSGTTTDFTDLHAWAEVYLPGAGWIGFDPTSGLVAGEGHIPLACTPDPGAAAPITGMVDDAETSFDVVMTVSRILETPRVTKPYSEEQWAEIEALGRRIDVDLKTGDVRLTMGGEPTFISIDDMDGAEWTMAALGPAKRRLAGTLVRRLKERWAPGGLLHFGQGKWYPGEPLPRWSLNLIWRRDGVPIWRDPALIGDDSAQYGFTTETGRQFAEALADRLDVASEFIIPAYEDAWHYLWQERRLPINVDPLDNKLPEPEKRERIAAVFEQGVDRVVGYVLPLQRRARPKGTGNGAGGGGRIWASSPWFMRQGHLFLVPGDSPIGLRLPLDSLPWVLPEDAEQETPPDPFEEHPPLPPRQPRSPAVPAGRSIEVKNRLVEQMPPKPAEAPRIGQSAAHIVRTALSIEVRNGALYIFLPPVTTLEDGLELVAAIEDTAAALGTPVFLEGYVPPKDHRVRAMSVTPDPGVIEVNVQPAENWAELVEITTGLYAEARQTRLGAEKFMIDGRHVGTGGGNHIVMGAAKATDSPLLRRPDLLKSLIGYWNNHPSLSRLFSGLFIGPTSQAPRVDEARDDTLYELGIAFEQIPMPGSPGAGEVPPWMIDRILRHLLVDVTGNTHRAEFCIDKLYSPDGPTGRLGLLELRAFEMPPHDRMSLTQQLLLRALVAWFWREPYTKPLVRWGGDLSDRWLLPHFVAQDFGDVIADLRNAGYDLAEEWFAPHMEFRFPRYGAASHRGMTVELRQALEPWHVLGEETTGGGTVRYVDSTVERLQIKATGFIGPRYIVSCNGRRVPLHPTGTPGEFIAAVRFRAWPATASLHPTIEPHAPLVFDIFDLWTNRSVGGCTYYVAHPGGRNYSTLPVNAYEAESRRLARFFTIGHTPGPAPAPAEEHNPAFPLTLDLRRRPSS